MQTAKNLQKSIPPPSHLTESDWRRLFAALGSLNIERLHLNVRLNALQIADASFRLVFDGVSQRFIAEYKPVWDERTYQSAIDRALDYAKKITVSEQVSPLVALPYLSEERIAELERRQVSGIDLCGNALIFAPGRFYIRSTGRPNRFRIEQAIRDPYSGKAALVGRTLLREDVYSKLEDLRQEILRRRGEISLAMVSRTIQALEADNLVTPYWENKVRLYSPSRLMTKLIEGYRPKKIDFLWRGSVKEPMKQFLPVIFQNAATQNVRCVVTGIFSASRYVSFGQSLPVTLYADATDGLLAGLEAQKGERFVAMEIYAPPEDNVFFDSEQDEEGVIWASPVQSMIETGKGEESRLQEVSIALRNLIMDDLNSRDKQRGG